MNLNQTLKFFAHSGVSDFKDSNDAGRMMEIGSTIALMDEAASATPKEDSVAIHRIVSLINLRKDRYERLGRLTDLDKTIELEQQVVTLTPQESSNLPARLNNLGSSLEQRFKRVGDLADIEKAIAFKSQAVSLTTASDPDLPVLLSNLGCSLESRFDRLGDLADLHRAIECIGQAASLTPEGDPDISSQLGNLGCLLQSRFERLGELKDLEGAIEYLTRAASLTPQGHSSLPIRLINLGGALMGRFDRLGELKDLGRAIEHTTEAVLLTPEGHSNMHLRLNNLGCSYDKRFERLGELKDLDMAIKYKSHAVSLAPRDHPSMPNLLNNLGFSLNSRFERLGELDDLSKAIVYKNQAILLTPQGHPEMPRRLSNLGISLQKRFSWLGDIAEIDKAIEHLAQAVSMTAQGHPDMPTRLLNLGGSLNSRFKRVERLEDLIKAIQCLEQAALLTPPDHSDMPRILGSLASAFTSRYDQHEILADLDKAIELQSQAVSLTPKGHSDMPRWLNNLGFSYRSRFQSQKEQADLDKAIEYTSQAVSLTPQDSPNLPARLNGLAYSLESRFQQWGKPTDLDQSIEYKIQAVSLTPQGHLDLTRWLSSLGSAYRSRFNYSSSTEDIQKSLEYFQKATESSFGLPVDKFTAAVLWARTCVIHQPSSALTAYQHAMSLLPEVAWLGSTVNKRYSYFQNDANIATEVAAAAIKMKNYGLALEWMEESRMVVWKQMLQLRTPLHDLASVNPTLAAELQRVAGDLDSASSPKSLHDYVVTDDHSLEQTAQQHRRLATQWKVLVEQVQATPGFESFLRPLKAPELVRAAHSGPVVVVNVDKSRCDALIIRPGIDEILHVPLNFSHENASKFRVQLNQIVHSRDLTERKPRITKRKGKDDFENMLTWLWDEVVKPVLAALEYIVCDIKTIQFSRLTRFSAQQTPSTGDLPHITWCTTGPLSFLPLHAAGDYDTESVIFNYVTSSYVPTLSTLLAPRSPSTFSGLLVVGQKATPGLSPLPGTDIELGCIQKKWQGHAINRLDGDLATPTTVLAGMEDISWVHLACHAMQDTMSPLQSSFYLHGGTLTLAAITGKRLKHAELAFLSACQTAVGEKSLSEEAVHLAAGMLMAGYRTVIATMWSIGDADAPLVAEEVYAQLLSDGAPNARRAAVAVHKATALLREKVGAREFSRWVPYIHIGM